MNSGGMFGANQIRKQELRQDGELWVQEISRTIQGEGPLAGRPAVFIRLSGCNLACKFCDTEFESGRMLHWRHVVQEAASLAPGGGPEALFVITGGEPFRQDIREMVDYLITYYGDVQIETAGTLWLNALHPEAQIVVSPKTGKLNQEIINRAKYYKYIIRDGEIGDDGLPNVMPTGVAGDVARPPAGSVVYLQPCDDHDSHRNVNNLRAARDAALRFGYRLSIPQHKILELP